MGLSLSRGFSPATMDSLSDDALSNIFARLPAKQLTQMRCISKSWNDLLSQPSFIKLHLDRSIQKNDAVLLMFLYHFSFDSEPLAAHSYRSPYLELPNFIKLPHNPQFKHGSGKVIGSVHGLICFEYRSYHDPKVIYIWNPSLSAWLTLPPYSLPTKCYDLIHENFRFGYDPKSDDYKVVKITKIDHLWMQPEVYSMRKGSWKLITADLPSQLTGVHTRQKICVDGQADHLHWLTKIAYGREVDTILSFDLGTETFHEIPLPASVIYDMLDHNVPRININLGVLAGKLCVISDALHYKCEVWVMDEYGVAESWVKQDTFPPLIGDLDPFGFTSQSEFLYRVYPGGIALYDPVESKTKSFKSRVDYYILERKVVEYVDSLVWVKPAEQSEVSCFSKSRRSIWKKCLQSFWGILVDVLSLWVVIIFYVGWFWALVKDRE